MTPNLTATVFVYQQRRKPYRTRCVYLNDAHGLDRDKAWQHTATLNPAVWIEYLLNHPGEREKLIEEMQK